jgi:hypothetical protein
MKKKKKHAVDSIPAQEVKYTKKIEKLDMMTWLVFDALRDGKLVADEATSDNFEVMTAKTIHKCAMKLVKKGLANVKDGVFTMSKYGKTQFKIKAK